MPIECTREHDRIRLWDGDAPGALGVEDDDIPELFVYPASDVNNSGNCGAVVICPGGGYGGHAPHEAEPLALWLNDNGIAGAVLKYRLGPKYHHPAMLTDASRAIRTLRADGARWGISPNRIGVLGFSAGGHLASTASVHYDVGDPFSPDAVERATSRPDVSILIYPVVTLSSRYAHVGSRDNLLGTEPSQQLVSLLSNENHVTAETPPTFLVHAADDDAVPPENSLNYALALSGARVPYEMHLYEQGGHGFGMGEGNPVLSRWPHDCTAWLRRHGF